RNYKQPFAPNPHRVLHFNGDNSRLDPEYADANDTGRSTSIWSLAASYIWDIHTLKVADQQRSGSTGYHYGGYPNQGGV
ncbi:outer membrane porin, OprD family, partial [Klebsiella variicola]|nr:outer membrane porin, OprD family [Klebsiella variicola]